MSRVELFDNDLRLSERKVAAPRAKDDMIFGLQKLSNPSAIISPQFRPLLFFFFFFFFPLLI